MNTPHSPLQLLPLEIITQIADLVAKDSTGYNYEREELLSMVKLCRSWKDAGEKALWSTVTLDSCWPDSKFLASLAADDIRLTYIKSLRNVPGSNCGDSHEGCFGLVRDELKYLVALLPKLKLHKLQLHLTYDDWLRVRKSLASVEGLKEFTLEICGNFRGADFQVRDETLGIRAIPSLLSLTSLTCDTYPGLELDVFFGSLIRFNMKTLILKNCAYLDVGRLFLMLPNLVELKVEECIFEEDFNFLSLPPSLRKLGTMLSINLTTVLQNLKDTPFFLSHLAIYSCSLEDEYTYLRFGPASIELLSLIDVDCSVLAKELESIESLEFKKLSIVDEKEYDDSRSDEMEEAFEKIHARCINLGVEIEMLNWKK